MYARSTTEVMYEQLVDGNGPDSSWGGVGGGTGKQELNLEWPYFRISLKLKVHEVGEPGNKAGFVLAFIFHSQIIIHAVNKTARGIIYMHGF